MQSTTTQVVAKAASAMTGTIAPSTMGASLESVASAFLIPGPDFSALIASSEA
jgi:hypothetical protein